jgi:hypothetical protein
MLKECALKKDPTWSPPCFIIDDAPQERHVIKYIDNLLTLSHSILCSFVFEGLFLKMFLKYFHVVMGVVVFSF